MSIPTGNLSVWTHERTAWVRVTGRANFTTSVDFKKLLRHLTEQGHSTVVLDLSECLLMDSTFLGVLANEADQRAVRHEGHIEPGLQLVNPNARIRDLIDNLGVMHLFQVLHCDPATQTYEVVEPDRGVTKSEIARTCLEAHEALIALNPANAAKFKDVTRYFAENLRKIESEEGPASPAA